MNVWEDTDFGLLDTASCMVDEGRSHFYITIQRGGVREILFTGLVGHHRMGGTIIFIAGRLTDGSLFNLHRDFIFVINGLG